MFLFLDRDGVINQRTPGKYIVQPDELELIAGVPDAIMRLRKVFKRVLVVTNQAGVSKGILSPADLALVHAKLKNALPNLLDGVYFCPHTKEMCCNCRKPQPGMAWLAQFAYAEVRFAESWMVGDSASDIAFGSRLGMKTVRVGVKPEDADLFVGEACPHYTFSDLVEFANWAEVHLAHA